MTWLEIRPNDVWLFRDGKPFSAGEDHSAHSMFPPTPLTLHGALRQKVSVSLGVNLYEYRNQSTAQAQKAAHYIGAHDEPLGSGLFKMLGPLIGLRMADRILVLLPAPADLFKHERNDDFVITAPKNHFISDHRGAFMFPMVRERYENIPGGWIAAETFSDYLRGTPPDNGTFFRTTDECPDLTESFRKGSRVWQGKYLYASENRFGVATDAATSFREDGQLYQAQFIRPHIQISLLVSVTGVSESSLLVGSVQIGGEQRQSSAYLIPDITVAQLPEHVVGRFKVVFLTPSYFSAGWEPKEGNWTAVFGQEVKFRSAALYRPQRIGGWNGAANRPRTMHNYVAPGSVYYFETDQPLTLPDRLLEKPPEFADAAAVGFGAYAVGSW